MSVDARVRAADEDDADQLAKVHLASWRWAYQDLLPRDYLRRLREDELAARWWKTLSVGDVDESIRVVELDGVIGGFITFGPRRDDATWLGFAGEIYMLYLAPHLIGHGLGQELLDRAFHELARNRCHWVVVWVLAKNARARRFYERAGMRLDGARRWEPFCDRAVPVVRYAKAINPVIDFESFRSRSRIG